MKIRNRIYFSFFLLVSLFGVYSVITIITLNDNRVLSKRVSEVVDPLLQANSDFNKLLIESKMYTTNWVFLRAKEEDKQALIDLHKNRYPQLRIKTLELVYRMSNFALGDSLEKEFAAFDNLVLVEQQIMSTLVKFDDYDDPFKRLSSENLVESEILPRTDALMAMHERIKGLEETILSQAQTDLEQSSALFRSLIMTMIVSIFILAFLLSKYLTEVITKPIHRIINIVNRAGKGILEKVNWKASNDEIGEMVRSVNTLSEKLKTHATFAMEIGKRNFDIEFQPLSEKDIVGKALISMRDNLRSNDELKKANLELDKFVYSCSHDLRAPLTSMLGVVEIASEDTEDPLMKEHLKMIKKSIRKLDGFISDILTYSRNARMDIKKEEINFKEVVGDITNDLKYMNSRNGNVEIKTEINDSAPFRSDKSRINIVLNNLISNAIRYQNPANGDPLVNIKVDTSDTETHIVVRDNGIGISKDHQEKIFDMFYRVSENSVGSGLGLYIVKEAIEKLNGRIEVESVEGKGTAFNIVIPNGDNGK